MPGNCQHFAFIHRGSAAEGMYRHFVSRGPPTPRCAVSMFIPVLYQGIKYLLPRCFRRGIQEFTHRFKLNDSSEKFSRATDCTKCCCKFLFFHPLPLSRSIVDFLKDEVLFSSGTVGAVYQSYHNSLCEYLLFRSTLPPPKRPVPNDPDDHRLHRGRDAPCVVNAALSG
jgi:hypothetical protein